MYAAAYEHYDRQVEKVAQENPRYQELKQDIRELTELADSLDEDDKEEAKELKALNFEIAAQTKEMEQVRESIAERIDSPIVAAVLMDEIEKAHPDIHNWLLPVLDEGVTELRSGKPVDFKKAFVAMTSNVASKKIAKAVGKDKNITSLGFGEGAGYSAGTVPYELAQKELKDKFPPEFLGRIDDIVVFDALGRSDLRKILDLQIADYFRHLLHVFPFALRISDRVKKYLVQEAIEHQKSGARALKGELKKGVQDPIARLVVTGKIDKGDKVIVDMDERGGEDEIAFFLDNRDPKSKIVVVSEI